MFKLLCELPNVNYLCTITFNRYLNNDLAKLFDRRINSFSVFEKGTVRIYMHDEDWEAINKILFKDFLSNPEKLIKELNTKLKLKK